MILRGEEQVANSSLKFETDGHGEHWLQETAVESSESGFKDGSKVTVVSCPVTYDLKYNTYTCFSYAYTVGQ